MKRIKGRLKNVNQSRRWFIQTIVGALSLILFIANFSYAATVHYRVTTDKTIYQVGEKVNWTVWAWASQGDNRGALMLKFYLDDNKTETLEPAFLETSPHEFLDTAYGDAAGFIDTIAGSPIPGRPGLQDVSTAQTLATKTLDIGNDGLEHVLAKGSYTLNSPGEHELSVLPVLTSSLYWVDETNAFANFTAGNNTPATFAVTHESDANLDRVVNYIDFALMGKNWLTATVCAAGNDWCDFSDIDRDGSVGVSDIEFMGSQWLDCSYDDPNDCLPL